MGQANTSASAGQSSSVRDTTQQYYDSNDADGFYSTIWGGEDLHIGVYENTTDIREASDAIVDRLAATLSDLTEKTRILDIGSGYGGSMRRLVTRFGCRATCLNLSQSQNETNREKTREAGLIDRITIRQGVFENIPEPDASFDIVWSQDAILHSDQRTQVLREVWRVLKPGGLFVYTDPCETDDVPNGVLQPVYDRLQLSSLASFRFYREAASAIGFDVERQDDLTDHLRTHYSRVRDELDSRYDELRQDGVSMQYLDQMLVGLENWVNAADAGYLAWGIQLLRKPT